MWQQEAKNAFLQLTEKMELEHKRSKLRCFASIIVLEICFSCLFVCFFFLLVMLAGGPHLPMSHFLIFMNDSVSCQFQRIRPLKLVFIVAQ